MNELLVSLKVKPEVARVCLDSIKPEIDADMHGRSTVELSYDKELVLRISAKDLHAMRAAANTYIRWLDMCVKLMD